MLLNDNEQNLFHKLLIEELKSYGFSEDGEQITPVHSNDVSYVRILLGARRRLVSSIERENKRKERYEKNK